MISPRSSLKQVGIDKYTKNKYTKKKLCTKLGLFTRCFSDVIHFMKSCLEFKYDVDPVAAAYKVITDMEKKAKQMSPLSSLCLPSPPLPSILHICITLMNFRQECWCHFCRHLCFHVYHLLNIHINYYVPCVFGFPHPVNHVTDWDLHFTGLLFVGVFKNITCLKSESLLY